MSLSAKNISAEVIDINNSDIPNSIGKHLLVFIDDEGVMSSNDVINLPQQSWTKIEEDVPNFGFSSKTYWFKTNITNSSQHIQRYSLIATYPLIDEVDYYIYSGKKIIRHISTGDNKPFANRFLNHRFFYFPLQVRPNQELTVYFRMKTEGSAQFPLELMEEKVFVEKDQLELAVQVLFIGIMMAIAGYNLVLFLFVRELSYLYYVAYVTSYSLMQFTMRGLGYQWIWPFGVGLNESILLYSLIGTVVFAGLFSISFLDLKNTQKLLFNIIRILIATAIICGLAMFFTCYCVTIQIIVILVMISAITMMVAGISQWPSGNKAAKIYTIAWTTFWVGAVLVALNRFGIIPRTFFFENATQIGATIEAFLLSLALAERINSEKKKIIRLQETTLEHEKDAREANERALQIQKEANEKLEDRVNERTDELQKALEELEKLRTIDTLTQTRNRAFFDDIVETEWCRATRSETTLALIFIDIDHFKQINDKHGHLVGDEALRQIANLIMSCIKRPADSISRYGGEEFAILLPHTTFEGALSLAEKIRCKCESNNFDIEKISLKITLSIGVSAIKSPNPKSVTIPDLINTADKELYKCKNNGRNQVSGVFIDGAD